MNHEADLEVRGPEEGEKSMPASYETHRKQLELILQAWGMSAPVAASTAEIMSWADLHGIDLIFTHENVDFAGCDTTQGGKSCAQMGVPMLENDVMQFHLSMDIDVKVTSIYATYGLTDRIDFGIAGCSTSSE